MKTLANFVLQLAAAGGAAYGIWFLAGGLLEGQCGITRFAWGLIAGFTLGPALGLTLLQLLLYRHRRLNPPGAIAALLLGSGGAIGTLHMMDVMHSGSVWLVGLIGVSLISTAAYNLLGSRRPSTTHATDE